jgi:hypothetical protein
MEAKIYFTKSETKICCKCGEGTTKPFFCAWECKSCKGIEWVRDSGRAERREEGSQRASANRATVDAGRTPTPVSVPPSPCTNGAPLELRKGDQCWYNSPGGAQDKRVEIIHVDKAHADGMPSYVIRFIEDGRERETEHFKLRRIFMV